MTAPEIADLRREAQRAERRIRLGRALAVLPSAMLGASAVAAAMVGARKIAPDRVPDRAAWVGIGMGVIVAVGAMVAASVRRLPPQAGALALDRHHGLRGRLANALAFGDLEPSRRTPMMRAAVEDALEAARDGLSPRHAVTLAMPGEAGWSVAVLLGLLALAFAEVRSPAPPHVGPTAAVSGDAVVIADDDIALLRESLARVDDHDDAEVREAVERFNRLIEDLAERRLSRDEAFRRMQAMDDDLARESEEEREAMRKALAEMAHELSQSELAKPGAEAMRKQDFGAARDHLRKLADQLDSRTKPDRAQLERLKKALERASQANRTSLERLEERRAELRTSLLKAKDDENARPRDERERSLLRKKERELERLDRGIRQREAAGRRLERLERQLGKAAADLLRDLGLSADDLRGLTEDLNRLEQDRLTDEEKEELRQRIQELREMIRQQGQGGEKLRERLQRFMKQARGGGRAPTRGGRRRSGGRGGGEDDGNLRPGGGSDDSGEDEGDGEGRPGGLRLGRGGRSMPVEVEGGGRAASGSSTGEGDEAGGSEAGAGSASKLGRSTDIDGRTIDVEAQGLDAGRGATNAEVIHGAAERGFRGSGYRKVFKQYQTVAEEQVGKETIPDGMRFYVRRYFQLIRPRE